MTFYGEALGLDSAGNVSGTPLASFGAAIHYLYRDTSFATVSAGESFIAGMFPDPQQLTSGDAAVCSWVVECGEGSSGTIRLSSGMDPTWTYDNPSYLTEGLGEHAVTGASRVVVDTTSVTAANILAGADAPALFVECVSGSVQVLQVRLRVWPVGGPSGAWRAGDSYTEPGTFNAFHAAANGDTYGYSGPGGAAVAGRAAFSAATPDPWASDGTPVIRSLGQVDQANETDPLNPNNWGATFGKDVGGLKFSPSVVSTTTAGTAGVHPDVVPGDLAGSVRAVGGGPLYSEFGWWSGGVRITTAFYNIFGENGPISASVAFDPSDPSGTPVFPTGGSSYVFDDTVPLPDYPSMVIGVESDIWYTDPPDERQELVEAQLDGVSVTAIVPAHEWWDPSLPWVERKPRFWVKDLEGDWRPVGFGKPASDLSVFHVWTPVGWYRECRDGEVYSDAHPLKVKLYDGTWDTVAHMRPV